MLGKQVAILGSGAIEQALSRQAAAGKGLQVDLTVIPGTDSQLVKFRVDQNQNSLLLVGTQKLP